MKAQFLAKLNDKVLSLPTQEASAEAALDPHQELNLQKAIEAGKARKLAEWATCRN